MGGERGPVDDTIESTVTHGGNEAMDFFGVLDAPVSRAVALDAGDLDAVLGTGYRVRIWENNGDGTFVEGANAFLRKPAGAKEILASLREVMKQPPSPPAARGSTATPSSHDGCCTSTTR